MEKFKWVLALLVFCFKSNSAQEFDTTLVLKTDTNRSWYTKQIIPPKKVKPVAFIAPALLIGYGFVAINDHGILKDLDLSTKNELQEDHPFFSAHVDDYLQFAPAVAVYALNISGIKGKHNLFDASLLYVSSAAIMGISTHFLKQGVGRLRPNGKESNSFPSGHTASAFAAAEFLHQEFKEVSPWIGYSGYFVASATGTLRMYNDNHWFSDVIAGAGIGIASAKIAYLVYPQIKKIFRPRKASNFTLIPTYNQGTKGMLFLGRF